MSQDAISVAVWRSAGRPPVACFSCMEPIGLSETIRHPSVPGTVWDDVSRVVDVLSCPKCGLSVQWVWVEYRPGRGEVVPKA